MDVFRSEDFRKYTWIELTGFDRESPDYGVGDFLSRAGFKPTGVSFLLFWLGFVLSHEGLETEKKLSIAEDSYAAHPFAPERPRQDWTNLELKGLIDELHRHGISVLVSFFGSSSFTDDDGNYVTHPFFEGIERRMRETDRNGNPGGGINMLKRLPDGTYFSDLMIEKTVRAMNDYGFDGIQIADGISSPRVALEQADFSDDLVSRFSAKTGIEIPADAENTGAWIWENHRLDWIYFNTGEWEQFYLKFMKALNAAGKYAVFNSAWTRDPFEAMYRYGVDYRKVIRTGVRGCMVEDTSAGLAILAAQDNLYLMTDEQRRRVHYEFLTVLMLNRACMKGIDITPLAGVHDTMEQWGVLEHMPTAMTRNVMNNLCTYLIDDKGMKPVTDGPYFCLSDGLSASDWAFIKDQWNIGAIENATGVNGATLIWSDARVDNELSAFTADRTTPTHRLVSELLYAGAPVYSVARIEHLQYVKGDIIVTNPGLLPEAELENVLGYKNGAIFLIGVGAERDGFWAVCRENNTFGGIALTVNRSSECRMVENDAEYDFDPVKGLEKVMCIWTHPLAFRPVSDEFFLNCADSITEMSGAANVLLEVMSDSGKRRRPCKCVVVNTGEKSAHVLVTNDDYYYNIPEIDLKRRIRSVKCLTKYNGYKVWTKDGMFRMRIPGRGAEALEVEFE